MTFLTNPVSNIDENNSTNVTGLVGAGVYGGASTITTGYKSVSVSIKTDKNSAESGFTLSVSNNNSTWYVKYARTYIAGNNFCKTFELTEKYYIINYVNGADASSSFVLTSTLSPNSSISDLKVGFKSNHIDFNNNLEVTEASPLVEMRFFSNPVTGVADGISYNSSSIVMYTDDGNITGTISNATMSIAANGTANGRYISQSRRCITYQPGQTMKINMTGILNSGINALGCISRIGYYDDYDGIYFEYTNDVASVNVLSSNGDVRLSVPQSEWNVDTGDGNGQSGYNIDWTKFHYFIIKFIWLGVGPVLFAIKVNDKYLVLHIHKVFNNIDSPWCNNPNLPMRYELQTTTGNAGSMLQGCGTVMAVGKYFPTRRMFSVSNGATSIVTGTTETALLAITGCVNALPLSDGTTPPATGGNNSVSNTYYHQEISLIDASSLCTTNNTAVLVRVRGYFGGAAFSTGTTPISWIDVNTENSVAKYATAIPDLDITNSVILSQGYSYSQLESLKMGHLDNSFNTLGSNVLNEPDVVILTVERVDSTASLNCIGTLSWEEIY